MLDRRVNAGRLWSWAVAATLAVLIGLSGRVSAATWGDFPPTSFKIYSPDGSQVIGTSRFFVEREGSGVLKLHGENHYRTGQYDIEIDTLEINPGEAIPRLVDFSHVFYQPDGARFIAGNANLKTGEVTCMTKELGPERIYTDKLDFPPDTYAGASILIPIEYSLHRGIREPIRMHLFDCTPKPKLLTIEATPNTGKSGWPYYPGQLIEVEAKPDLGILDLIAAPFLPTMHAWFNPAQDFSYVGGGINRYFYSKEHVLLVKLKPNEEITTPEVAHAASDAGSPAAGNDTAAAPVLMPAPAVPDSHATPGGAH
ncbi:MAG TPA: hypothetical protein VMD75_02215 [Candidatus Binataceae bacterium]|nr:hypothetical protein [Candidatus Binataceae bacterium]